MRDCIADCALPIKVYRSLPGRVQYGRVQESEDSELCAHAVVYPLSGDQLRNLPEGRRQEETVTIITSFQLQTVSSSECDTADIVEYCGVHYQIEEVKDWSKLGGFYEAMGVRCTR